MIKIIAILETTSDDHTNWIRFYQLDFKFSLGNQINTQVSVCHKEISSRSSFCLFLALFSAAQHRLPQRIRKEKNRKYFATVEVVTSWVHKFP